MKREFNIQNEVTKKCLDDESYNVSHNMILTLKAEGWAQFYATPLGQVDSANVDQFANDERTQKWQSRSTRGQSRSRSSFN